MGETNSKQQQKQGSTKKRVKQILISIKALQNSNPQLKLKKMSKDSKLGLQVLEHPYWYTISGTKLPPLILEKPNLRIKDFLALKSQTPWKITKLEKNVFYVKGFVHKVNQKHTYATFYNRKLLKNFILGLKQNKRNFWNYEFAQELKFTQIGKFYLLDNLQSIYKFKEDIEASESCDKVIAFQTILQPRTKKLVLNSHSKLNRFGLVHWLGEKETSFQAVPDEVSGSKFLSLVSDFGKKGLFLDQNGNFGGGSQVKIYVAQDMIILRYEALDARLRSRSIRTVKTRLKGSFLEQFNWLGVEDQDFMKGSDWTSEGVREEYRTITYFERGSKQYLGILKHLKKQTFQKIKKKANSWFAGHDLDDDDPNLIDIFFIIAEIEEPTHENGTMSLRKVGAFKRKNVDPLSFCLCDINFLEDTRLVEFVCTNRRLYFYLGDDFIFHGLEIIHYEINAVKAVKVEGAKLRVKLLEDSLYSEVRCEVDSKFIAENGKLKGTIALKSSTLDRSILGGWFSRNVIDHGVSVMDDDDGAGSKNEKNGGLRVSENNKEGDGEGKPGAGKGGQLTLLVDFDESD